MTGDLWSWLRQSGATDEEIERATAEGWLPLLALDRYLLPGEARYDLAQLAAAAGTDTDTARRMWRALGFPDTPLGVPLYTDRDLDALRVAVNRYDPRGWSANFEQQIRVVSAALARIAAVEADVVVEALDALRAVNPDDGAVAEFMVERFDWDALEHLFDYAHRVQLRAALWRALARGRAEEGELAVGFADLTGYTALSERLEPTELDTLLRHFDAIAYDTVAELGGRVVKTIGDEVMFVGLTEQIVEIAVALVDRAAADEALPGVRAGVASGLLLAREGDYYGPVVNLASRIAERARPGTALVSDAVYEMLCDDPRFVWVARPGERLRGLGTLDLWEVRAAS